MVRKSPSYPSASVHVELLYGTSVLGTLMTLRLPSIHHHHKTNLEHLQQLFPGTPEPVVMFLAWILPASGLLHLRMLGHLGMIIRRGPQYILHQHGRHVLLSLSSSVSVKLSWFLNIRNISKVYGLPDPLKILQCPPRKEQWTSWAWAKLKLSCQFKWKM